MVYLYTTRYIEMIVKAKNDMEKLTNIINLIYNDGFEDGVEDTSR